MQINMPFVIYTLSIGLFMALHYTGFKMLKGDPSVALFWIYCVLALVNLIVVYISGEKIFSQDTQNNILWILVTGVGIGIFVYLTVRGFQAGFSPVLFPLSNTVISTAFLLFISYFFFKSNLNIYNVGGLLLGVSALYLLSVQ